MAEGHARDERLHLVAAAGDPPGSTQLLGRIVAVDEGGCPHVTYRGAQQPVAALVAVSSKVSREELADATVLLAFEAEDRSRPIIIGLVSQSFELAGDEFDEAERDITIGGRRIAFEAGEAVTIRCGKSSITLRPDGKVEIRGKHLVSRASGPNKIKGGSVSLN